jgi:ABC-type multidrug transport system fused ATPase/permease subunit
MASEVPICLHPIALVQLLQFWVPMDAELETALFSAIRLPTVLAPFDSQAEKVSLRILNALSTFENIAEMPEDTTTRILLNEALRQKLALEKDLTVQIELVKEALVEENRKAEERVIAEKARNIEMLQQSKSLEARLARSVDSERTLQAALQEALAREKTASEDNLRLVRLERERADSQLAARLSLRSRLLFTSTYITSLALCLVAYVEAQRVFGQHLAIALIGALVLAAWAALFWRQGSRAKYVRDWLPFRLVMAIKFWLILAIIGGIIGNGAWEQFKQATKGADTTDRSHPVLKDGK